MTDPATPEPQDQHECMSRFARLWVESQTILAAYVHSAIASPHEADDLLQDIAEQAVRSFDTYDSDRPFTGWLLGIARHRIADHLRRRGRDRMVFDDRVLDLIAAAHERISPHEQARRAALRRCLSILAPRQRHVLRLRYVDALRPARIADHVDLSANAVTVMLHRIRHALLRCIERRLAEDAEHV